MKKSKLYLALVAAAAIQVPTYAFAAEAESDKKTAKEIAIEKKNKAKEVEVIEITGSYSRSLEKAVDIKRSSIGFSDSIVATDIADFPEQNLAEALQRMPGVTIERNKGLGSKVNVRSLPSEFTHVSINDLATATSVRLILELLKKHDLISNE